MGPNKVIIPDILERLPGRGLWLKASRNIMYEACKKDVFSRASRTSVNVPSGLIDLVEVLLKKHCLDLLGIAGKAGQLVGGYEKVKSILLIEKVGVFIMASDTANSQNKIKYLVSGAPIINCFSAGELGVAIGRERLVYAIIKPGGFAKKLLIETSRLLGFQENASVCNLSK